MEECVEALNGNKQAKILRAFSLKSDILTKAHNVCY